MFVVKAVVDGRDWRPDNGLGLEVSKSRRIASIS